MTMPLEERVDRTLWTEPVSDAEVAAFGLAQGREVDYSPGDGTRYVCLLLTRRHDPRRWLLMPNLGNAAIPLHRPVGTDDYCRMPYAPVGSWRALRPLLAALGAADGPFVMRDFDAHHEVEARQHGADGEPLNTADAILGRAVRRLADKQERRTLPPGGEPAG